MLLRIGITENSDPSYDKSWLRKLNKCDGLVLVTKGLAHPGMIQDVLKASNIRGTILHCTCTGWGGTAMEPGVPEAKSTMRALEELIIAGFPAKNVVLRIDPIIPTKDGLAHVSMVLAMLEELNQRISRINQQVIRVRISVMDNYRHVIKRFRDAGYEMLYGGRFQADFVELQKVVNILKTYPDFKYAACAETKLTVMTNNWVKPQGCISEEDLSIIGLPVDLYLENPQNRSGCHCLSCKTEILQRNHACPHECLYCYWKRPGE